MLSTLSLPVNGDVMRGERASMVVLAGRPKLAHYLPSIRPSRFATLGLHNACVRVCVCVCVWVFLCAFILLSSSCRQLRSVFIENLSHWLLRRNWTGHFSPSSSLSLSLSLSVSVWVCICSMSTDIQPFKRFVWQINRGQSWGRMKQCYNWQR